MSVPASELSAGVGGARERRPPRVSKNTKIGLGLLLTLVGLFLLVLLFPSAPGALSSVLPIAAVGIVALWVGGILMGIGSRS
jgi:hypothetical protein